MLLALIIVLFALVTLPSGVGSTACSSAIDSSQWIFSTNVGAIYYVLFSSNIIFLFLCQQINSSYSCISSAGGVNDLGNIPSQCEGDPTSVRIQITPGKAECLVAESYNCKIPMHDFIALDYDFDVDSCMGIWAAPLWMTPDTWQWGGGSGEIDSLEFCARDAIHMNFAGGGHQVELNPAQFNIDSSSGHVTVRKDEEGIITVVTCSHEDISDDDQCNAPMYSDCDDCMNEGNDYACWCNAPDNIYGSGGCQNNTVCATVFSLESYTYIK